MKASILAHSNKEIFESFATSQLMYYTLTLTTLHSRQMVFKWELVWSIYNKYIYMYVLY